MRRFTNKIVVITGGTSGIGLAAAKQFIKEGAKVVVTGRSQQSVPCSLALALSQSKALFSSLVICVRVASGANVYPHRAVDQPWANGPSERQAKISLLPRCQ
jgi:NAD(P)-dependent dehydrogenase (short-subunit alcohol dehydrogenase family)